MVRKKLFIEKKKSFFAADYVKIIELYIVHTDVTSIRVGEITNVIISIKKIIKN